MENLIRLVNNFSRKRLLKNFSPVIIIVFIWGALTATPLFPNFLILLGIIAYAHPYLMDFEKERDRYFEYLINKERCLQKEISQDMVTLEKYLSSKPLDFTSYRKEYVRKKRYLEYVVRNTRKKDQIYWDFLRKYERELENIYFQGICEKREKITSLNTKLEFFKNRQSRIQKILEANKPPIKR